LPIREYYYLLILLAFSIDFSVTEHTLGFSVAEKANSKPKVILERKMKELET